MKKIKKKTFYSSLHSNDSQEIIHRHVQLPTLYVKYTICTHTHIYMYACMETMYGDCGGPVPAERCVKVFSAQVIFLFLPFPLGLSLTVENAAETTLVRIF